MQRDGFFFSFMKANSSAPIFMWSICLITCKHSTQDHLNVRFSLYFFFFPLLFSCSSSSIGSNNGGYSTVPCHPKGWFGTSLFFCLIIGITYPTLQLAKGISNMASFFSILLCLSLLKLLPMKRDGELHVTSNEAIFIVSICFIMCKHSLPFWLNILLRQFQFWNSFSPVNDVWLPLKPNKW